MSVVSSWVWVESMGVASGGCCKEVYIIPHNTYPLILLLYLFFFCSSIPTFCSFLKMVLGKFYVMLRYIYIPNI